METANGQKSLQTGIKREGECRANACIALYCISQFYVYRHSEIESQNSFAFVM